MSLKGRACIAGAFEHPTRKAEDKSTAQLHSEVAWGALQDAGLSKDDVDGYFCAGDAPGMGPLSMAEYLGLDRLHEVLARAEGEALRALFLDRDHHDRDVRDRGVVLELTKDGPPVELREMDVEQDRAGPLLARDREPGDAVRRLDHLEAGGAERRAKERRQHRVVVDDEHGTTRELLRARRGRRLRRRLRADRAAAVEDCSV